MKFPISMIEGEDFNKKKEKNMYVGHCRLIYRGAKFCTLNLLAYMKRDAYVYSVVVNQTVISVSFLTVIICLFSILEM